MQVSKETEEKIVSLFGEGLTIVEISKQVGIGQTNTAKILKKHINPMNRCKKLTDINKLIEEYKSGIPASQLAKQYGVCVATVTKHLQRAGFDTQNTGKSNISKSKMMFNDDQIKQIIDMYVNQCMKIVDIGKHFGVSGHCIYEYLNNNDVNTAFGRIQRISGPNSPNWQGGISKEPYCEKWNAEFRNRVRLFFGNKCVVCGKTKEDNDGRKMSVHHVTHDKHVCCNDSPHYFVPLCISCHAKIHYKKEYWEQYFIRLINTKYQGKCYYTKDEFYG